MKTTTHDATATTVSEHFFNASIRVTSNPITAVIMLPVENNAAGKVMAAKTV